MNPETMTVEELLAVNLPEGSVFDELSRIHATASANGVEVTVNLEGRLTDLELAPHTLCRTPAELAGQIFRLTQEASAAALAQGMTALAAAGGPDLATELAGSASPTKPQPEPAPDFSTVETWAVS